MHTTSHQFRMVGTADPSWVGRCVQAAAETLTCWGAPGERVAALTVALAELGTNVCRHGYAAGAPGPLEVELRWDDEGLQLTLRDEGVAFDPTAVPDPPVPDPDDPDTWPERGMGLLIVRGTGDRLRYRRRGRVNELRLLIRTRAATDWPVSRP
ncbi:MAG: ATP-binding protein [Planctomycetes bacterium]|nr:ATP-binding protein [Planctomycetota bacterium]